MDAIDVFKLARARGELAGERPIAAMHRLSSGLVRPDGVVAYRASGEIDGLGRPALRLALHATLPLRCDRCGQALDFQLDVERQFFFVHTQAELAAIAIDDSPEEALLGSTQFDLAALIEDEVILQLPISPRHEGCRPAPESASPEGGPGERVRPFAGLDSLRARLRRSTGRKGPRGAG